MELEEYSKEELIHGCYYLLGYIKGTDKYLLNKETTVAESDALLLNFLEQKRKEKITKKTIHLVGTKVRS